MNSKKTIKDISWNNKTALVRVDFNVPVLIDSNQQSVYTISDDARIRAALPTINYLREAGAKVVLATHFGRPNGKFQQEFELAPIAQKLSELLHIPVIYMHEALGEEVLLRIEQMDKEEVLLLQNMRFYEGEESNSFDFSKGLAELADVYVNDAFGTAHRAHASTEGITHHIESVAGFLMEREIEFLGGVLDSPIRPLVAIFGGSKVSDKTKVLERILGKAESILIGGGMAATFLKATGIEIGDSLVEEDLVGFCQKILSKASLNNVKVYLPKDVIIAPSLQDQSLAECVGVDSIRLGTKILDIGHLTSAEYVSVVQKMKTILWNGPMGVFEIEAFRKGTYDLAIAIANSNAVSIVGGGSTAEAVSAFGLSTKIAHVSTGGGASLEYLEGKELPGIAALENKRSSNFD